MYESALLQANMVGLCVGTRPDCVPVSVRFHLQGYCEQGYAAFYG